MPGLGGRVMQVALAGEEIFYAEPRPIAWPPAERRFWGGSKTWLAPQSAWGGPFPEPRELDESAYRVRVTGAGDRRTVWMESPIAAASGLRVVRGVDLAPGILSIGTRLENHGERPATAGIWDVTQLLKPCAVTIAAAADIEPCADEGLSPAAAAHVLTRAPDATTIRCDRAERFKLGARAPGPILVRRLDRLPLAACVDFLPRPRASAEYAHGGRNVEVFSSGDLPYLEVEVHAPLAHLTKGEQAALSVVWTFPQQYGF